MSQDDEIPPPRAVWMTTEYVIERFGFDPRPYVNELKSKLHIIPAEGYAEVRSTRVWELNSVQYHPAAKAKE